MAFIPNVTVYKSLIVGHFVKVVKIVEEKSTQNRSVLMCLRENLQF